MPEPGGAICSCHLKRVIAYSTCSQMGYLFMAARMPIFGFPLQGTKCRKRALGVPVARRDSFSQGLYSCPALLYDQGLIQ